MGATPSHQQIAILIGSLTSALVLGPILLAMNQSGTVYVPVTQNADFSFPAEYRFTPDQDVLDGGEPTRERLLGAQAGSDVNSYKVVHKTTTEFGPAGRYLVNDQGAPVYLADPGINGVYSTVPETGQTVTKFSAPKATLMSYIIKGVLGGDLPWALIFLGTIIAITLELAGTSSLAFAVGMYLPLSTSTPILVGGVVRWGVDRYLRTEAGSSCISSDATGSSESGSLRSDGLTTRLNRAHFGHEVAPNRA